MQVKLTGDSWPAWLKGHTLKVVHKRDHWYVTRDNGDHRFNGWNVETGSDRSGFGGVFVEEDSPPPKKVGSPAKIIAIKSAIGRGLEDDTDPAEILNTILDILDS